MSVCPGAGAGAGSGAGEDSSNDEAIEILSRGDEEPTDQLNKGTLIRKTNAKSGVWLHFLIWSLQPGIVNCIICNTDVVTVYV